MVTLVGAANIENGKTVMIRSPSGDIGIIALFKHKEFDGITILIGNGIGKSRKIIDMSTSLPTKIECLSCSTGNDYVSSFFGKVIKFM